jgi:hypothetical protein
MKITSLILGILGGISALATSVILLVIGHLGEGLGAARAGNLLLSGRVTLALAVVGIVGGALALSRPLVAGILMLVSGAGGFIALWGGYIWSGPLLIAGGVLALIASRK